MSPYREKHATCPRFEAEELFKLQLGQPLSDHVKSCPGCTSLVEAYKRLERSLANLGDESPAADWEAKVRARILNDRPRVRERRWKPLFVGVGVASALAGVGTAAYVALSGPDRIPPASQDRAESSGAPKPSCVGGDATIRGQGRCHMLFNTAADFRTAQRTCAQHGATLVAIDTEHENRVVRELATRANQTVYGWRDAWIGLEDTAEPGSYRWPNGAAATYVNWSPGEPNHGVGGQLEHCAVIKGSTVEGAWDDRPCELAYPFICERPDTAVADPLQQIK